MGSSAGPGGRDTSHAFIYLAIALLGTTAPQQRSLCTVALPILMMIYAGVAWIFYAAQQVRLLQLAPPSSGAIVVSLNASSMYFGFASGVVAGAAMLQGGHIGSLARISAAGEFAGFCLIIATALPRWFGPDVVEPIEGTA